MIAEKQSRLCVNKYLPRKDYLSNKKQEEYFKKISAEYSLKRNNFNPNNNGSPNLFINKLKKRYTNYYES